MNSKILAMKNRLHILEMRDPVTNYHILQKLRRRLRKLES